MRAWFLAFVASVSSGPGASAAVIVIANYTVEEVSFTIVETGGDKVRKHTILAHHVMPYTIEGPAELKLLFAGKTATVRVDPANAYVIVPDREMGVHIEGLELPGQPPERDNRPELNPVPRTPVKIPVTLLVDEVDPRADRIWQAELRKRFDSAAAVIEAETGFHLEFAGFSTWASDAKSHDLQGQLATFEGVVKVKPGALAVGFTSQKLDDNQKEFGACRGLGSAHVLIREWRPKGESERMEVLVHYLAVSLGAVSSPDPGSAMRNRLGDGQALHARFVVRLDPLNVLALNLLADQRRLGINQLTEIPLPDRVRLHRVYSALLNASPGDPLATDYLNLLEKDVAKGLDPKKMNGEVKRDPQRLADRAKRTETVRAVVRAITERAKANTGPAALQGDDLTLALLRAAGEAAQKLEEVDRVTAFLLGIGIALDDSNLLRDDPLTSSAIADAETNEERLERLAVLGNPTFRNRRDLCRRFAAGCAAGELLTLAAAENSAIGRAEFDLHRPAGLSFPALAAEFAGIELARTMRERPEDFFQLLRQKFAASELVVDTKGLRDGLGVDKFEEEFGGTNDDRFKAVLTEIRKRLQSLPLSKHLP